MTFHEPSKDIAPERDVIDRGEHRRRVARLDISHRAVAEEVVQDAWLGAIRGLRAFDGRSMLTTWIFRILVKTSAARAGRMVPFAGFDTEVADSTRDSGASRGHRW